MQTFSIGPGNRWWIQVITCNPLVRRSDRIELVVITCAALLTILAVPIAGAIGTSVHDERTRLYAAEAQARHQVLATATQNGEVVPQLRSVAFIAAARWTDSGISHSGTVAWPDRAKLGDQQRIWVNSQGEYIGQPSSPDRADLEAVTAALVVWLGVAEFSAGLVYLMRLRLDRWRLAEWDRELNVPHNDNDRRNNRS